MRSGRGDVDDRSAAARHHMVQDRVNAMQNATDVDVDHSIPIANTSHAEGRNRQDSRIVDQHVNPAKPLHCQGSERLKIRSEENTSELQSLMRITYVALFLHKPKHHFI